jgi:hypothetical protein
MFEQLFDLYCVSVYVITQNISDEEYDPVACAGITDRQCVDLHDSVVQQEVKKNTQRLLLCDSDENYEWLMTCVNVIKPAHLLYYGPCHMHQLFSRAHKMHLFFPVHCNGWLQDMVFYAVDRRCAKAVQDTINTTVLERELKAYHLAQRGIIPFQFTHYDKRQEIQVFIQYQKMAYKGEGGLLQINAVIAWCHALCCAFE